jgi:energy-coupling factor transport system ATP-binding protein
LIPTRIAGELRGGLYLDDTAISGMQIHDVAQRVGMVFQNPDNQLVQLSVEEEVAFGPENLMLPTFEIEKRVVLSLQATGMLALRNESIFALSGGQKQRVAIAATLAMRPQVLVLDEPTSDLDPVGTQEVLAVLRALNRESGTTIVLIEHKVDEVIEWVDRVLLMDRGEIIVDASPSRAFVDPSTWQTRGVAIPQIMQVAQGYPRSLPALPLGVHGTHVGLRNTPVPHAVRDAVSLRPPRPATPDGQTLAAWRDVDLVFGRHQVLFDVSMSVRSQEWVALIGANGSGKTSLAYLVTGMKSPNRGTVLVNDRPVRAGSTPSRVVLLPISSRRPTPYCLPPP